MKKSIICLLVLSFCLTGCKKVKDTINKETSAESAVANSFDNTYYNTINTNGSAIRETIYNDLSSNQNDYNTIGRGLQILSLDYYSNKDHYLKEGSYISADDYSNLLGRSEYSIQIPKGETVDGVSDPVIFESLVQQEYVKKNGDQYTLSGISIAIAVSPDAEVNGVTKEFTQENIIRYSKEAITKTYNYFASQYEDLANVPILVSVYQLAKATDATSGKFILSSYCQGGVGDIKNVDMETVVFTSDRAKEIDNALSSQFVLFKEKIKNAAIDATGVVGYATYLNGKIISMRIEFRLNTKTFTETNALMNVAASEMDSCFTTEFDITGIVYAQNQLQGFILKKAGEKAYSHTIY